jgi:3',5'-cyclic AMP phosphodiesterase CpdA
MRIAHCSDLHLLSLAGARVLDFANKRWIGGLNLLANRGRHYHAQVFEAMVADFNRSAIDHVVVTGDVTNLAFEEEFRFARRFFDAIELGPEHVTVLPGNHDAYVARGAEYFAEQFDSYNRPDAGWEWPPIASDPPVGRFPRNRGPGVRGDPGGAPPSARWPVVRVRGPLAVIALSTSLATPWFTAYGRVGPAQLERLEAALSDPRLAGRFRLVAIHHPPAGARAASVIRGLKDRSAFAEVLANAGAELVLHGHEHLDLRGELPGPGGAPIPVRGIQSGTYEAGNLERRARYRIYEIAEPAGPGSRPTITGDDRRVWDPERRRFVPEATASIPPVAA